jgi:hypothetical protein
LHRFWITTRVSCSTTHRKAGCEIWIPPASSKRFAQLSITFVKVENRAQVKVLVSLLRSLQIVLGEAGSYKQLPLALPPFLTSLRHLLAFHTNVVAPPRYVPDVSCSRPFLIFAQAGRRCIDCGLGFRVADRRR